jgi:hypothetical protein
VQFRASPASYAALIGENPGKLKPPPPLPLSPADVDDACEEWRLNHGAARRPTAGSIAGPPIWWAGGDIPAGGSDPFGWRAAL